MVLIHGERRLSMADWKDDKKWSDRFLVEIKRILGEHLISEPPIEEDMQHNTDLIVLRLNAVRIACRIRTYGYFEEYPHDITIRSDRPSGIKTELTKIIEGWGDYLFYGFSNKDESGLCSWKLISLNNFRLWFNRQIIQMGPGKLPGIEKDCHDGSAKFRAFNTSKMPPAVIFKKSDA
jgi:hypothetical protein